MLNLSFACGLAESVLFVGVLRHLRAAGHTVNVRCVARDRGLFGPFASLADMAAARKVMMRQPADSGGLTSCLPGWCLRDEFGIEPRAELLSPVASPSDMDSAAAKQWHRSIGNAPFALLLNVPALADIVPEVYAAGLLPVVVDFQGRCEGITCPRLGAGSFIDRRMLRQAALSKLATVTIAGQGGGGLLAAAAGAPTVIVWPVGVHPVRIAPPMGNVLHLVHCEADGLLTGRRAADAAEWFRGRYRHATYGTTGELPAIVGSLLAGRAKVTA